MPDFPSPTDPSLPSPPSAPTPDPVPLTRLEDLAMSCSKLAELRDAATQDEVLKRAAWTAAVSAKSDAQGKLDEATTALVDYAKSQDAPAPVAVDPSAPATSST